MQGTHATSAGTENWRFSIEVRISFAIQLTETFVLRASSRFAAMDGAQYSFTDVLKRG